MNDERHVNIVLISFGGGIRLEVHFVRVAGGEVLVPVQIGERNFDFLLDTGSTASVIDPAAADTLGLTPQGKEQILTNFRSLQADVVEAANLKIGKLTFNRVKLAEINLAPISGAVGTQVDGAPWVMIFLKGSASK